MVNQQLLEYIKQQQQMGKTKEEIAKNLLGGGWHEADVEQGFASLASGVPTPVMSEFPKARQIFSESLTIYKNRFKTLVFISIVPILAFFILGSFAAIGAIATSYLKLSFQGWNIAIVVIAAFIALIFCVYIAIWGTVAQLFAIKDQAEGIGWQEAFKRSKVKINPFFSTGLLAGLAALGGFILFIVPGIIFSLWFSLSSYIVVEEGLSDSAALKRSKYYVKGRIGTIFGKLFYIGIISAGVYILVSIVIVLLTSVSGLKPEATGWLNNIFSIFWTPLATVYGYLVYKYSRATRP